MDILNWKIFYQRITHGTHRRWKTLDTLYGYVEHLKSNKQTNNSVTVSCKCSGWTDPGEQWQDCRKMKN